MNKEIINAPLMYKGILIKKSSDFLTLSDLSKGIEFNIQFRSWTIAKEFIDNLK